jgi:hypothetical protein
MIVLNIMADFSDAIIKICLLIGGCVCLYMAFMQQRKRSYLRKNGVPADGTVIRLEQNNSRKTSSYFPVIRFVTLKQEVIIERHHVGSYPPDFHTGQQVQILYDPAAPKQFIIGSGASDRDAYILGIIGLLIIGGTLFTIIWL